MSRVGVAYLLTHEQHAARLVVSMFSLRHWYSGPITLFTTRPTSREIGQLCSSDPFLRVNHEEFTERIFKSSHRSAYLTKTRLMNDAPYARTVFLDADTLVVGQIDELLEATTKNDLVVTGFMGGATNVDPIRKRLKSWKKLADDIDPSFHLKDRINTLINMPYPGINVGVMGFRRRARFLRRWVQLAEQGNRGMLPDEISLQILLLETEHQYLGYQYNCHPYGYDEAVGVKIWHFAGSTHLRDQCHDIWVPAWEACSRKNIARINSWSKVLPTERSAEFEEAVERSTSQTIHV